MIDSPVNQNDGIPDYRAQLEVQALEAAQRRERALLDQRSAHHSAAMRVHLWEKLHQVRLPRDPVHPILIQVAQQTALTLAEVLEVQSRRTAAAAAQQRPATAG